MKARHESLELPDSPHVFVMEVNGENHHFKRPNPGVLSRYSEYIGQVSDGSSQLSRSLYVLAPAVGLFWSHRGKAIEAKPPSAAQSRGDNATEAWDDYTEAVLTELDDAGISGHDIMRIGGECMERVNGWVSSFRAAQDKADFTPPPEDTPSA